MGEQKPKQKESGEEIEAMSQESTAVTENNYRKFEIDASYCLANKATYKKARNF